jgi:TIR domain
MAYEHDIFISYRRSATVGRWVQSHLAPLLNARINEEAPAPVRVFCDFQMEEGTNWPAELKHQVRGSKLLLAVWSADYFRSPWCMAEWQSFRQRENLLGFFSEDHPQGLVYPLRYADGSHFHPDAQNVLLTKDFSSLNYPDEVFRQSAKYLEFDDLVKKMAVELVARLAEIPSWRDDFPIIEPEPLTPAPLSRPVI